MNAIILEYIVGKLDLPESAYEKAKNRYEDIGVWLERDDALSYPHNPHIFSQGSFRLGTAIRPLSDEEEYDLDLACELREGIVKDSHSQKMLKELVGNDIEAYRRSRGIVSPLENKHRCWRLEYQDDLSFHIDIVPCIPEEVSRRMLIKETMLKKGEKIELSERIAELTVVITDDRHVRYDQICDDWLLSNPEGYALWFESRMRLAESYILGRAKMMKVEKIDDLQYFQWKTPLQRSIQLLKRHRDQMFKDKPDSKPISIIITTLASRAYQGELDLSSAMNTILGHMGKFVSDENPRVPNPVNPAEDFADRWTMPKYKHLHLELNFNLWLSAARADFKTFAQADDISFIIGQASNKFGLNLNESGLKTMLGISVAPSLRVPKEHQLEDSSKPWRA